MHKFFVDEEMAKDMFITLKGDDVKHIYKVLRLQPGEKISVNNCNGKEFIAVIIDVNKLEVKINIVEEISLNNESSLEISLYQGLPKSSKMDLIVQKATELGVKSITPIITDRVIVKSELSEFKKTDRWRRIALEACKQSKRSIVPEINPPIEFVELLEELKKQELIIVPYEEAEDYGIKSVIKKIKHNGIRKVAVIIGPEGGFEEEEVIKLKHMGAEIVTLGPRILRTETAGFVVSTILMYELGDIGGN